MVIHWNFETSQVCWFATLWTQQPQMNGATTIATTSHPTAHPHIAHANEEATKREVVDDLSERDGRCNTVWSKL